MLKSFVFFSDTTAATQPLYTATINHLAISEEKKPGFFSRFLNRNKVNSMKNDTNNILYDEND